MFKQSYQTFVVRRANARSVYFKLEHVTSFLHENDGLSAKHNHSKWSYFMECCLECNDADDIQMMTQNFKNRAMLEKRKKGVELKGSGNKGYCFLPFLRGNSSNHPERCNNWDA